MIGASPTPGSLGASVIANLERMGFAGDLHLVNPKRSEIHGRPCLSAVAALPEGVDAAVLAIPRAGVLETLRALVERKVGAAVIFSSGFAEGGAQGLAEQQEIARLAADSGMAVEGPNCLGLVNYVDGIALTFVETPAVALGDRPGIAIVSQSGAMAAVLGVMLNSRGLGLSYSVSTGNEAASGVEDYIEFLLDDPHTRTIGMIVEHFRQPQRFLAAARRARERGKRIVILHPGRSAAARESAATHTGALAGDYDTMKVKVEQQGVLLAGSLEELGDLLELIHRCPVLPQQGAVVMTESGAFKALTLDLCEQIGLSLPALNDARAPALRAAMPEFVPVSNPLDLTAQALVDPDLYRRTLAALLQDERFGTVVFGIIQTDPVTCDLKFPPILQALRELRPDKAVIFAGLDEGAQVPAAYVQSLRELGVPYFPSAERALRAVARLVAAPEPQPAAAAKPGVRLDGVLPAGVMMAEYQAKQLLAPLGVPFPVGRLVRTLDAAHAAAAELGFPVVLKAQSVDLPHKSDAGGVIVGLHDETELAAGWAQLQANLARNRPGLVLEGVLVECMGPRGVELIVGGRNDPEWGAVVLVGFGGVQAELLKDVRLLPPDLGAEAIIRELQQLRCAALLGGFRGAPPLDVEAVAGIMASLGALLQAEPRIAEIDLNPVVVYPRGSGALALDALIGLRPST
ncbi:MAG: acetate--CoA ligase family protein [Steroidobacteraceae bacterium]